MSKKLIDQFRNLDNGKEITLKGKRQVILQTRHKVQKALGRHFTVETIEEDEVVVKITRDK